MRSSVRQASCKLHLNQICAQGWWTECNISIGKFYAPQMKAIIFYLIETAYNQRDNQGDGHYLINSGEHSRGVMLSYCSFWLIPVRVVVHIWVTLVGRHKGCRRRGEGEGAGWEDERRRGGGVGEEHAQQLTTVDGGKQLTLIPNLLSSFQPSPAIRIALRKRP